MAVNVKFFGQKCMFVLGFVVFLHSVFTTGQGIENRTLFETAFCLGGGIGRHAGLKIPWPLWPCGFKSRPGYHHIMRK